MRCDLPTAGRSADRLSPESSRCRAPEGAVTAEPSLAQPPAVGPRPVTILAIDDNAGDARLLREQLEQLSLYSVRFLHAFDTLEARAALGGEIDAIFLDYQLGAQTGEQFLRELRSSGELRPVIALTAWADSEVVAGLMRAGADDYLLKGTIALDQLQRAIENARAQYARRMAEQRNRELLHDLRSAKARLEAQNRTLAELYDTAHQFVDHVSHEFRTPLTVIREFASILRDGIAGTLTDEQGEYLGIIVNRVDDLSVLVDDMLDISKLEVGELGIARREGTVAGIIGHVRSTLERRADATGAQLRFECPDDLPRVYCDPEKAGRTMTNLVINAIKFCGSPGLVTVRATHAQDAVRIAVTDNGPGIPAESVAALFERFRQFETNCRRGLQGFGLGLSIAKGLVHLNLGEITVDSTVGQGSTFAFTIPTAERGTLMQRYTQVIRTLQADTRYLALVHISAPATAGQPGLDELEQLLWQTTGRGDLLFRPSGSSWQVVLALPDEDTQPWCARFLKAHARINEHRTNGLLPAPMLVTAGVWPLEDPAGLVAELVACDREPDHV